MSPKTTSKPPPIFSEGHSKSKKSSKVNAQEQPTHGSKATMASPNLKQKKKISGNVSGFGGFEKSTIPVTGVAKKRQNPVGSETVNGQRNGAKSENSLPSKKRRLKGDEPLTNSKEEQNFKMVSSGKHNAPDKTNDKIKGQKQENIKQEAQTKKKKKQKSPASISENSPTTKVQAHLQNSNEAMKASPTLKPKKKKKNKGVGTDIKVSVNSNGVGGFEDCTIPTRGVAEKRKNPVSSGNVNGQQNGIKSENSSPAKKPRLKGDEPEATGKAKQNMNVQRVTIAPNKELAKPNVPTNENMKEEGKPKKKKNKKAPPIENISLKLTKKQKKMKKMANVSADNKDAANSGNSVHISVPEKRNKTANELQNEVRSGNTKSIQSAKVPAHSENNSTAMTTTPTAKQKKKMEKTNAGADNKGTANAGSFGVAEKSSIPTTVVSEKKKNTVGAKMTNGQQNGAKSGNTESKKSPKIPAYSENSSPAMTATPTLKKKKKKKGVNVAFEESSIPTTTGVAEKSKNLVGSEPANGQRNGAKLENQMQNSQEDKQKKKKNQKSPVALNKKSQPGLKVKDDSDQGSKKSKKKNVSKKNENTLIAKMFNSELSDSDLSDSEEWDSENSDTEDLDSEEWDSDVLGSGEWDSEDFDSEEWDSADSASYSSDSDESGLAYLQEPYDSDSCDEDYVPSDLEEHVDDLVIPRGAAQIYDIDDASIPFEESESQIIEIPCNSNSPVEKEHPEPSKLCSDGEDQDQEKDSEEPIPTLVPIYNEKGEFIDTTEKLEKSSRPDVWNHYQNEDMYDEIEKSMISDPLEREIFYPYKDDEQNPFIESINKELEVCMNADDRRKLLSVYQFYDSIDKRMSLAVLQYDIYFCGHITVQVLFGRVEIMGYRLDTSEARLVTATLGYCALNITPKPTPEKFDRVAFKKMVEKYQSHFADSDMENLLKKFDPKTSVLVLLQHATPQNSPLAMVNKYFEEFRLISNTSHFHHKTPLRSTQFLLEVKFFHIGLDLNKEAIFEKNPEWDDVKLTESSRLIVVGGKCTGKSTFVQFMINRYIRQFGRILLLDLDIGQPLVYLPETVSATVLTEPILGVGYFAKLQPLHSILFGSVIAVSSPMLYIKAVHTLVKLCKANPDLAGIPWIVNTMGYLSGFGEELSAGIVRIVHPTDVVQLIPPSLRPDCQMYNKHQTAEYVQKFNSNILRDEVDEFMGNEQQLQYRFYPMNVRYAAKGAGLLPVYRRTLSVVTKLVEMLGDKYEWFTDIPPFCANLDDVKILITRDGIQTPSKEMLGNILNGMMVYLCEDMGNGQYNCLGVGIVRAIDPQHRIHLLHCLSPEQLAKMTVLALCTTSLPSQISLRIKSSLSGTIPYIHNMVERYSS